MAGNGRGQMRSYNSNRSQSFIFIGLLVVIAILCFNYWNLSTRNSLLSREILDVTDKMRQTNMRKISIEKRNDALMQQVRENSEATNKVNNEFRMKEEEIGQLKNQVQEKDTMLSANRAEIEELKQTLETCQENEKTVSDEKEQCEKKLTDVSACETQLLEIERKKQGLLDFLTSERIRILSSLGKTYGKKLLEVARSANIIVDDVPTGDLPEESLLNPQPAPAQNAAGQGESLKFVSQGDANQNLNGQANDVKYNIPSQAGQQINNALPQFPNVNLVGSDNNNNLPQKEPSLQVPDSNGQQNGQNNQLPDSNPQLGGNNQNPNQNMAMGNPDSSALRLDPGNDQQGSNLEAAAGAQPNQFPAPTNASIQSQNANLDVNPQGNEGVPGERPREGEVREMAQQGAPAIVENQKANSNPDQVPLGLHDSAMAPNGNGQGIVMQQAPPGDLAPKGVQEGEGPQGHDQVKPPLSNNDEMIEVEEHRVIEDQDGDDIQADGDLAMREGDQVVEDPNANDDDPNANDDGVGEDAYGVGPNDELRNEELKNEEQMRNEEVGEEDGGVNDDKDYLEVKEADAANNYGENNLEKNQEEDKIPDNYGRNNLEKIPNKDNVEADDHAFAKDDYTDNTNVSNAANSETADANGKTDGNVDAAEDANGDNVGDADEADDQAYAKDDNTENAYVSNGANGDTADANDKTDGNADANEGANGDTADANGKTDGNADANKGIHSDADANGNADTNTDANDNVTEDVNGNADANEHNEAINGSAYANVNGVNGYSADANDIPVLNNNGIKYRIGPENGISSDANGMAGVVIDDVPGNNKELDNEIVVGQYADGEREESNRNLLERNTQEGREGENKEINMENEARDEVGPVDDESEQ